MAERQMTIDDYLNNNKVSVMETMTPNPEADVIIPELVDYNALKKEELIIFQECFCFMLELLVV